MTRGRSLIGRVVFFVGFLSAELLLIVPANAFQSTQIESFTCGVVTGGSIPADFRINHIPLIQGSEITKDVLIFGEVGRETPLTPPAYEERVTPGPVVPTPQINMRAWVEYEVFPPGPSGQGISAQDTPTISTRTGAAYGTDPMPFAFQLDPDLLGGGFLRYRIVAQKGQFNGNNFDVVGTTTFPPSPNTWVEIGVQANASLIFGSEGGRFILPDGNPGDGETALDIPAGLLTGPTQITIDEVPLNSPFIPAGLDQAVRVYRLESDPPVRGTMQLSLLYPDFEYPLGQDGTVDGLGLAENKLGIAWWDGFKWRKLGANSNPSSNLLSVKIGFFNFMAIIPASAVTPAERRPPQKIITPNGDSVNDDAQFDLSGAGGSIQVEIFDMSGHRVRSILSDATTSWDGRNDSGEIVESGVYIYQYSVDGERISGLIAVAK